MKEIRSDTTGEFSFFESIEEAEEYENTTFNIGEMPRKGVFKYQNKIYQIQYYNNETRKMEVIDIFGKKASIDAEENAMYLGDKF